MHPTSPSSLRGIFAMSLLLLLPGCSHFSNDWNSASKPLLAEAIDGQWTGTWTSENGHGTGELKCLLTPTAADHYLAQFNAAYWSFFHFDQTVTLITTGNQNGHLLASGDSDLGLFAGGVYHYEADITPSHFTATYSSSADHGKFDLHRAAGAATTKPVP